MKLLFCIKCNDLFKISTRLKRCRCGECFGKYTANRHALISDSDDCMVVRISNTSFRLAINTFQSSGEGIDLKGTVIEKSDQTVHRIKEHELYWLVMYGA